MSKVTPIRRAPARPESAGPGRPVPPPTFGAADGMLGAPMLFAPANDVGPWVEYYLLRGDSPLHNPDHQHLLSAIDTGQLVFLWASSGFEKQSRTVLGTAEQVMFRAGGWQKHRQELQMQQWFGHVPEFVITLAGDYCLDCADTEFAALVEHELYHVGQDVDRETGEVKFSRDTGLPKLKIRGHDVEEFIGVVRRYGVPEHGALRELVETAAHTPEIGVVSLTHACGICLERAA